MARPVYNVVAEFSFSGPEFKYTKQEDVSSHYDNTKLQKEIAAAVAKFIEDNFPFEQFTDQSAGFAVDAYVNTDVQFEKEEQEQYYADLQKENDEYQAIADAVSKLGDKLGIKHTVWSMDTDKLFTNEVFHKGKVYFQHESDDNVGKIKTNPTYQDLWKIADKLTAESEDFHHCFLESAEVVGEKNGVVQVQLWYGS